MCTWPRAKPGDVPQAEPLLMGLRSGHVLADWAYDSDDLRRVMVE